MRKYLKIFYDHSYFSTGLIILGSTRSARIKDFRREIRNFGNFRENQKNRESNQKFEKKL